MGKQSEFRWLKNSAASRQLLVLQARLIVLEMLSTWLGAIWRLAGVTSETFCVLSQFEKRAKRVLAMGGLGGWDRGDRLSASCSGNQCGWDRLDPGNLWMPSDQHGWETCFRWFAWLRTAIHRKIKIEKKDLVLWQTNNRLWDFALNILNNPISSLEKWGCFNDRVYVSIYFPCTSVWMSLSTLAEVNSLSGAYPCYQVWEQEGKASL